MRFVKKSSSNDKAEKKWEDLSDREKYEMKFTDYLYKKTKAAIQEDIYEKKIKQKTTRMQKFQDFILDEVSFHADHK